MRLKGKKADAENFNIFLHHLKDSIPEHPEWAIVKYRDVARDFAFSVFNIHLIFSIFGHSLCEDALGLSMQLFMKSCGADSGKNLAYFQREMSAIRNTITAMLGDESDRMRSEDYENPYPELRSTSPVDLLRAFSNPDVSLNLKLNALATNSDDIEACQTVDPVATTFVESGLLPSNGEKFKPKLFQIIEEDIQASSVTSVEAMMAEESVYQSLLSEPVKTVDGFSAPLVLLAAKSKEDLEDPKMIDEVSSSSSERNLSSMRILKTNLNRSTIYQANVAKYYTVEDQWRFQKTLVFVHDELKLKQNKKGMLRDVIKLQYLHQDDFVPEAMYLGKRYRRKTLPKTYHNDVIMHQLSLHCVSRFNKQLTPYPKFANRIRMVPVAHMEVLDGAGSILEVLNVEPFICGNFTKMTNNHDLVNTKVDPQLLLAFSHFTWCDSDGKFMVTDLQGWIPEDSRTAVILTDPAVNSEHLDYLGITNMGSDGFKAFWTKQHPRCNEICRLLKLKRDSSYPDSSSTE